MRARLVEVAMTLRLEDRERLLRGIADQCKKVKIESFCNE